MMIYDAMQFHVGGGHHPTFPLKDRTQLMNIWTFQRIILKIAFFPSIIREIRQDGAECLQVMSHPGLSWPRFFIWRTLWGLRKIFHYCQGSKYRYWPLYSELQMAWRSPVWLQEVANDVPQIPEKVKRLQVGPSANSESRHTKGKATPDLASSPGLYFSEKGKTWYTLSAHAWENVCRFCMKEVEKKRNIALWV